MDFISSIVNAQLLELRYLLLNHLINDTLTSIHIQHHEQFIQQAVRLVQPKQHIPEKPRLSESRQHIPTKSRQLQSRQHTPRKPRLVQPWQPIPEPRLFESKQPLSAEQRAKQKQAATHVRLNGQQEQNQQHQFSWVPTRPGHTRPSRAPADEASVCPRAHRQPGQPSAISSSDPAGADDAHIPQPVQGVLMPRELSRSLHALCWLGNWFRPLQWWEGNSIQKSEIAKELLVGLGTYG